jgi:hypothetical protein
VINKLNYSSLFILIFVLVINIGCGNSSEPVISEGNKNLIKNIVDRNETNTSILITNDNNISLVLNNYIDKIFSNVDLSKNIQQYHFENILIFANLYSSMYDKNASKKFNNFLYTDFTKRKNQISEDLKNDGNRLSSLQFLYLYSQNLKNNLQHNDFLDEKVLEEYNEEYIFLIDSIILPFWYDYPAWHWAKKYSSMEDRITAKIEKKDSEILKYHYYTAFTDEDGFSCAITSDLLYINRQFSNKLSIDLNITELEKLKHIRDKCTEYIKQKTILEKNNFHFGLGDWSDHPSYDHAGCDGSIYPKNTCIDETIESDTSHFYRFPWWIKSMKDGYKIYSKDNLYFISWLKEFSIHFEKKILVKKENTYLLNNYINGTNGWFRVNYHKEYENFGYGAYELSLISALGAYYTLAEYNKFLCSYIDISGKLFKSSNNPNKHYFDEKYPTTYTKFLKDMDIYEDRFKYYEIFSKMADKIWCLNR